MRSENALVDADFAAILFLPYSPRSNKFLVVAHTYLGHGDFEEYAALDDDCERWCRENLVGHWDLTWNASMRFMDADDAVRFMLWWW